LKVETTSIGPADLTSLTKKKQDILILVWLLKMSAKSHPIDEKNKEIKQVITKEAVVQWWH